MSSLLRLTATFAWLVLGPVGCASPLELSGDPTKHGMLVVEAEVDREFILGMTIGHSIASGAIVNTDRLDQRISAKARRGSLVFSDLPPGDYAIARLTTAGSLFSNWDEFNYVFRHRELPENLQSIEVRTGQVTYVGPVAVAEASGFSGIETEIRWREDPVVTDRAVRALKDSLAPSPWATHLAEQDADSTP